MTNPVLDHLTMTTDLMGQLLRQGKIHPQQQVKLINSQGRWQTLTIEQLLDESRIVIFSALQQQSPPIH